MVFPQQSREPAVGSAVRVLPVAEGGERTGSVTEWTSSPAGLVVTARVALAPDAVTALSGQRVWAHVEAGGGAVVLEAAADAGARGDELVLTGVMALASEARRAEPRVGISRRAQLRGAAARTVDLSRTGARLELPTGVGAVPAGGDVVDVLLEVGEAEAVAATARVVRVDAERQEVAVSFVDLVDADVERIDRLVLAELAEQQHSGGQRTDA